MPLNQSGYHKTIQQFKSLIKKGLASPTRYAVEFKPLGSPQIQMFPESLTLPARGLAFFTDTQYGAIRQYPYKRQYNTEIVMTFALSEDQSERRYFEGWMNLLVNGDEISFPEKTDPNVGETATISVLNHFDQPKGKFKMFGMYPSSIIPSNYGYAMVNEYAKLQITFNYHKYEYFTV